nr:unnamed protein product [Callosobruchus chinensis]
MSRGYGKYRRGGGPHSGFHFDSLFKENTNKPSAARSAASVGKWGITSFTSIRTLNGVPRSENASTAASTPTPDAPPKPKKFFKSRNTDPPEDTQPTKTPPAKRSRVAREPAEKTREQPTRKFFSSKGSSASSTALSQQDKKTVLTSNVNKREKEKPPESSKPPIVLRICRGKSQLLNDSDESESTPTPSSTPTSSNATSPRAAKDTARPANCRITRSARRSMQQDNPGSSPATADTPGEFSLFLSPRETEGGYSPQYIPAEKYELERKAMYDNLLRPNSPSTEGTASCEEIKKDEGTEEQIEKVEEDNGVSTEETEMENEEEHKRSEVDDNMEIEEPMDLKPIIDQTKNKTKEPEPEPMPHPVEEQQAVIETSEELSKEDENVTSAVSEELQNAKDLIQEDWSSDSDSNSTTPETEVKSAPELEENKDKLLDKILEPPSSTDDQLDGAAALPPPVKLVISKKKGCIFKSRSKEVEGDGAGSAGVVGGRKRRAVYRFKDDPLERVTTDKGDVEVTSVRCTKSDKGVSITFFCFHVQVS